MTKEEREQAIEVLQAKIDSIEDDQAYSQLSKSMYEDGYRRIDACKAAIAALREPAHEWVRTTDRLPTEEDAIEVHNEWGFTHKEVAVLSSGWPFEALVKDIPAMLPGIMDIETIENKTTTFPYWMPLPKPPEVEE